MNTQSPAKIGFITATIMSMNAMIGAGIFSTPAKLATSVGPAGLVTYIFVIIAVWFMAQSLARVAQAYPQEGAFYAYTKPWAGHIGGIIAAACYIIGIIIAISLVAQLAGNYIHTYVPSVPPLTISLCLIFGIALINMFGVEVMKAAQYIFLSCTLFSIISTIVIGFLNGNTGNFTPFMPHGWYSVLQAAPAVFFALLGFESAASLYTIVDKPEKNVPRALTTSIIIVGLLYISFVAAVLLAIPSSIFTSARIPLGYAIAQVFPNYAWLGHIIGISVITALFGVIQSLIYSVSTLIQSFLKLLHTDSLNAITTSPYEFKIIIAAVAAIVAFLCSSIHDINLFFGFTAVFIVWAFLSSILTLVFKKLDKTTFEKVTTTCALVTGCLIFSSTLYDLILLIAKNF